MIHNYYSTSLIFLSGICLFSAVNHFTARPPWRQHRVHLLFAVITLLWVLVSLTTVIKFNISALADQIKWERVNISFNILVFAMLPWFFALYSGVRARQLLVGASALSVLLFFINLIQPNTLLYSEIHGIDRLLLPWGEEVFLFKATPGIWGIIASVYVLLVPLFGVYVLFRRFRRDRRHSTLIMMFGVVLLMAAMIQAVLVRVAGIHNLPPLGTYGYLSMVFVMGITLTRELREDRKRAEEELRESQALYHDLVETSQDLIWQCDAQGRYIYLNLAWGKIFGYQLDDMLGRPFSDFQSPQQAKSDMELFGRLLQADGVVNGYETVHLKKDGTELHLVFNAKVVFNEEGHMSGTRGTAYDITERKLAEKALQESQYRYETLTEMSPVGVWQITPDRRSLYMNPAMRTLLELDSSEDISGKDIDLFFTPEGLETMKMHHRMRTQGERSNYELELIGLHGRRRYVIFSGAPLFSDEGKLASLIAWVTDITERKQIEEAMRNSERKTRAILDQGFVFIGLMSPDGILLDANRASLKLAGVTPLDVLNKPFWESPWWNHSAELQNKLRESIKSAAAGKEVRFEASHPAIDGSLRYVDFSLRPVKNEQDDVIYLIPEGHDITERKLAEESLKESQRKLATLMGNLPGLAYRCKNDSNWTMIFMSEGCFNLTGFHPQELVGNQLNTYGNRIHQDDAKMVWEKIQDAINNQTFWQIEYRIHTKEGIEKWVWEQGCGVYSNTGELEVLEGFISDITERKRAEEVLIKSEARLSALLSSMKDIIFEIDLNGRFESYYAQDIKGFYVPPDFFIRKKFDEVLPPNVTKLLSEAIEDIHKGESSRQFDYSLTIEKNIQYESAIVTPRHNKSNEIIGITVVCRNITERKRAEESLFKSEAFRRLVFESSRLPIVIMEADTYMYIDCNLAAINIYGYTSKEQVLGLTPIDVSTPIQYDDSPSAEKVKFYIEKAKNEGSVVFEWKHQNPDGVVWDAEVHLLSFSSDGKQLLQFSLFDITERKRAEKALEQSMNSYKAIFNSTTDCFFIHDGKTGEIVDVNQATIDVFGYTKEEIKKLNVGDFSLNETPYTQKEALVYIQKSETDGLQLFDWLSRRKSGELIWTENSLQYVELAGEKRVLVVARNITDRKKAEEALGISELRYRSVINASNTGAWEFNYKSRDLWCSPEYYEMLGYSYSELFLDGTPNIEKAWINLLHPDDRQEAIDNFGNHLQSRSVEMYENVFRLKHADGNWVWIWSRGQTLRNPDYSLSDLTIGTHINITDIKQMEKTLQTERNNFEVIFESSPIAVLILDESTSIIRANNAAIELCGGDKSQVIHHRAGDAMHCANSFEAGCGHGSDCPLCPARRGIESLIALSGGQIDKVEIGISVIREKKEQTVWLEVSAEEILLDNQRAFIVLFNDITERKKNEAILIKLYTAINFSKVSIVITDNDGNIEFANPYFTQLTGYTKEEFTGANPKILKSGIHTDEYYKVLWNTIKSGNTWEGEFCNRKKSGELYWEKAIITPIKNEKEEIINFVAVKSDITNEKKHKYLIDISLEIYEKSEHLTIEEILKYSIELGIKLTDSEIGFFHFVNNDQETISLQAWSAKTMDICNIPTLDKHYPISNAGVWVDCFYQKKPVSHNNYSSLSHKKGLPEGHATLIRDLSVPVIIENKVVAIFGVGNKKTDYSETDAEFLSVFADNVWNVVRRKTAEADTIKAERSILSSIIDAEERERNRFSRDIHDGLGPILSTIKLFFQWQHQTADKSKRDMIFKNGISNLNEAIDTIREISNNLSPRTITTFGVNGALKNYISNINLMLKFEIDYESNIENRFNKNIEITLYRIVTELINNTLKYANASKASINLNEIEGYIKLQYTDNGIGFDYNNSVSQGKGIGLFNISQRVNALDGKIKIDSSIGNGVNILIEIPLENIILQ